MSAALAAVVPVLVLVSGQTCSLAKGALLLRLPNVKTVNVLAWLVKLELPMAACEPRRAPATCRAGRQHGQLATLPIKTPTVRGAR